MDNLLIDLDRELTSTRRMLERYPGGKAEWRPHEKSRTLSALATHVANIPNHGANILTTAEMDVASRPPQPAKDSAAELLEVRRRLSILASNAVARDGSAWGARDGVRSEQDDTPLLPVRGRRIDRRFGQGSAT